MLRQAGGPRRWASVGLSALRFVRFAAALAIVVVVAAGVLGFDESEKLYAMLGGMGLATILKILHVA